MNRNTLFNFLILVVICSLYRLIPDRMAGFAPQIAMALFAGSVIRDKKWAFLMPLLSMFISDVIFELLYINGLSKMQGFYDGQVANYILIGALSFIGILIKENKPIQIFLGSIAGVVLYFLASNFVSWIAGPDITGNPYPKTWAGLMNSYYMGLPFLKGSFLATLIFNGLFFGSHYLLSKKANTAVA